MKTTIEISNYPLTKDYESQIIDFIERIKAYKQIKISVKATCTLITGEYETVFEIVQKEIKSSFEQYGKMIFVMKVLLGELDITKDF